MFFEKKDSLFTGRFATLFGDEVVFHGFSTRKGGVSAAPYDSLNLGHRTDDLPDRVAENRKRFLGMLGIPKERLAIPQQVHGDGIVRVAGPGSYAETDGVISSTADMLTEVINIIR